MIDNPPRITIGMPVYNGARYLRRALECLLAQDVDDFELVISDNASTDETGAICNEFAARDSRIRYFRAERNMGAVGNFCRVVALARGTFFAWAAHDDLWEPSYIRRCVDALEAAPHAVLAHAHTTIIDEDGTRTVGPIGGILTERLDACERFRAIVRDAYASLAFYGVMRTEQLRSTGLYRDILGGDNVLLAELALRGRFVEIPTALRSYRIAVLNQPPAEYWSRIQRDLLLHGRLTTFFPRAVLGAHYIGIALRGPISPRLRAWLVADVLAWYCGHVILVALLRDVTRLSLGRRNHERVRRWLHGRSWYRRFRRLQSAAAVGAVPGLHGADAVPNG